MMQILSDILPYIFPFIIGINGIVLIASELFFNGSDEDDKKNP